MKLKKKWNKEKFQKEQKGILKIMFTSIVIIKKGRSAVWG